MIIETKYSEPTVYHAGRVRGKVVGERAIRGLHRRPRLRTVQTVALQLHIQTRGRRGRKYIQTFQKNFPNAPGK